MANAHVLETRCKEEVHVIIHNEWANACVLSDIHKKLIAVYGDSIMSVQMVRRWCNIFAGGRVDISDEAQSGCPSTARSADTIIEVNEQIPESRRIMAWRAHWGFPLAQHTQSFMKTWDTTKPVHVGFPSNSPLIIVRCKWAAS